MPKRLNINQKQHRHITNVNKNDNFNFNPIQPNAYRSSALHLFSIAT